MGPLGYKDNSECQRFIGVNAHERNIKGRRSKKSQGKTLGHEVGVLPIKGEGKGKKIG